MQSRFIAIVIFSIITNMFDQSEGNTLEAMNEFLQIKSELNKITPRQIGLPSVGSLTQRIPCECDKGICKCCTGSALQVFGLKGCMEVVYFPDDFAFELRMRMNDRVLFKNKVSGRNPPPVCVRPPRFGFAKACVTFYDIYFFGRNVHVCMDIGGYFQGYELFSRSFDCLQMGMKGIKIVKPEEGHPVRPSDVEIDDDNEEIEDYDENVVRKLKTNI